MLVFSKFFFNDDELLPNLSRAKTFLNPRMEIVIPYQSIVLVCAKYASQLKLNSTKCTLSLVFGPLSSLAADNNSVE